jgi:hypothetical protein
MTMSRYAEDPDTADEPPSYLWRLAVHESAHAVSYISHGGRVTLLEAQPPVKSDGLDGLCEGELAADIVAKGGSTRLVHAALAALAGRAAERVFFGSIDDSFSRRDLQDFSTHVQRLEAVWHTGAPLAAWEKAIEGMLIPLITSHRGVISYVAGYLSDERSLNERRAMEIFGTAKRLWGIKPGPLLTPSWQTTLEAALTRHGARLR